jgi:hypothetical protein
MPATPIARQPNRPDGARRVLAARVDADVADAIERIAAENGHTVSYTTARILAVGLMVELTEAQ